MNDKIKELYVEYHKKSDEILQLSIEQNDILQEIKRICPHKDTREMKPEHFEDPKSSKRKCRVCHEYVYGINPN